MRVAPTGPQDTVSAVPALHPDVRETHTGLVILVGELAYKVKKSIRTDFLDHRTVAARERCCAREVLLNSRMAPQAYLGVGHFASPRGGADEPVVVMRRYPADRSLAALLTGDEAADDQVSALAQALARFHAGAVRSPAVSADARSAVVGQRWTENLDVLDRETAIVPAWWLADVRRLAARYLRGRAPLFTSRIAAGRIVDGHGDLQADDVFCMPEGPVVLDCLEFDERLRHVDGLDDAAFLAMDLEYRGRADLAAAFMAAYRRHAADDGPTSLAHFYVAYRAVVRAKVDCIRVAQGHPAAADDARRHVQLAVVHLRAAAVQLILVGGGPGSGKTTLAGELAAHLDGVRISTDDVRRELVASGEVRGEPGTLDSGRYDPRSVDRVYQEVLDRGARLLAGGHTVVLDASWRDPEQRRRAVEMADRNHCAAVELMCSIDADEAVRRIRSRPSDDPSEVTPEIAATLRRATPEWPTANRIDTAGPLGDSVAEAVAICCLAV